jgi:hypothetical protein
MTKKTRYLKITTTNPYEYFARSSGGNNRLWAKRYGDMVGYLDILRKSGANKSFIKGYESCLSIFHERDNVLSETREE